MIYFLFDAALLLRLAVFLAEVRFVPEAFLPTLLRLFGAFLRRLDVFLAAVRFLALRPLAFLGLRRDFFPARLLRPVALAFLGLRRAFFPARLLAGTGLLFILKHAEVPTPVVRTKAPFLCKVRMAVLTRALFLSTSYPWAARIFMREAEDRPLRSMDVATAWRTSSLVLSPDFLTLLTFALIVADCFLCPKICRNSVIVRDKEREKHLKFFVDFFLRFYYFFTFLLFSVAIDKGQFTDLNAF